MSFEIENGVLIEYFDIGNKNVTIPEGVTSIGNFAFNNCISIESFNLPDGLILQESMRFPIVAA